MRDFSILPPVDDSVLFQIVPALQTVPQGPRVPNQAPKLQNSNFPTHKCEPSLTGQGFLGAIIPCTAGNRISRGEPQTPASNYSLLPTSATPNIDVDSWKWHHSRENHGPLAVASAGENGPLAMASDTERPRDIRHDINDNTRKQPKHRPR